MRTVIVAGCRIGKSTLARTLGVPVFCLDPISKAKDVEPDVTYLPDGLDFGSESTQWALENWIGRPGPWVIEGHSSARLLRKWLSTRRDEDEGIMFPCDRVIVLTNEPWVDLKPGQVSLNKAVATVWNEIEDYFEPITEYAGHESSFHGSGHVD
jgi:hypothetical protein